MPVASNGSPAAAGLPRVRVAGAPYERGRQYGSAARAWSPPRSACRGSWLGVPDPAESYP